MMKTLLARLKLAEGYVQNSLRYWSNRLLLLFGGLVTAFLALPMEDKEAVLALIPAPWSTILPVALTVIVWWVRGVPQGKP